MILITNILYLCNEVIQFFSLTICAIYLGIIDKEQIKLIKIISSLIAYIGISLLDFILTSVFDDSVWLISSILYFLNRVLTTCILCGSFSKKIIYLVFLWNLSFSLAKADLSSIIANIINKNANEVSPFVLLLIQMTVMIALLFASKKNNAQRNISALEMIPRHIFIMLMSAIICLGALSTLISFPTDNETKKESTLYALVIILTVILISIVFSLFLNVIAKQHFTAVSQMMEKQVELQISHYEELEKIDAEISRFRHDYTNHLRSILSLIQMKEYSQAEEYIEKLQKAKYSSATVMFYTGNKLADALLADKSAALDDNCRIEYSGIIPPSIENVDLCVILSNALDNAVEACREFNSPCAISISAGVQQGYFLMSIKNPTTCPYNFYEIPPTTKSEKEQHGMGLYNIESTAKKNKGQIKVKCENGVFELTITMKI